MQKAVYIMMDVAWVKSLFHRRD